MSIARSFRCLPVVTKLAVLLQFLAVGLPLFAHELPLTDRQRVYGSQHIVVAVVESVRSRWNPQHTLIFTDYALRIEDRLKGEASGRITLSLPGGTLDGETHETCLSAPLEKGGRYLLFLRDLAHPTLSPVVGGQQGVFQEIVAADGKRYVSAGGGSAPPLNVKGKRIEFEDFVAAVRDLAARVAADPQPADALPKGRSENPGLPAKTYDPAAPPPKDLVSADPAAVPAAAPALPWTDRFELGSIAAAPPSRDTFDETRSRGKYFYQGRPPAPIVFDNFPAGFSFAPVDQYQMAYWNVYGKNLFRVYASPSSTWAFGNGVFDLAGFPDNSQMISQFGEPWGPDTLGITYARSQNGVIVEADIALNPAFFWTVDEREGTRPGGAQSFPHTMLHELGHSWGLKHPWATQDVWWDSVMNYAPKEYRFARLWTDDTTAVRTAYPGIAIRDGGLASYSTEDAAFTNHSDYVLSVPFPATVQSGASFVLVNPIKMENNGTVNLVNPTVEVYLVPQRLSFTGSIFLKSIRYRVTVKPFFTQRLLVGTVTVPRSVASGTYFLAFYLRDSKDKYLGNNSAWSDFDVTLTVTR